MESSTKTLFKKNILYIKHTSANQQLEDQIFTLSTCPFMASIRGKAHYRGHQLVCGYSLGTKHPSPAQLHIQAMWKLTLLQLRIHNFLVFQAKKFHNFMSFRLDAELSNLNNSCYRSGIRNVVCDQINTRKTSCVVYNM